MTVIVLLINYPKSTITVVHWNDDSNETLFSSYLLGPIIWFISSIKVCSIRNYSNTTEHSLAKNRNTNIVIANFSTPNKLNSCQNVDLLYTHM